MHLGGFAGVVFSFVSLSLFLLSFFPSLLLSFLLSFSVFLSFGFSAFSLFPLASLLSLSFLLLCFLSWSLAGSWLGYLFVHRSPTDFSDWPIFLGVFRLAHFSRSFPIGQPSMANEMTSSK